jgi:uncharacterized protein (TIGR00266 family)
MKINIEGKPAFAFMHVDLEPGEMFVTEADAMASMDAELDMDAEFNGGFFSGLLKKFLGDESLFVNVFRNNTNRTLRLTLTQNTPGDVMLKELNGGSYCLQPGAYIASTPGVKLGIRWAGFASFLAKEGMFKLEVSGNGTVAYGAYGALIEKEIDGEYIVDSGHLVGYDPNIKLKIQLSGGLFSSFFSGEGLVTRVVGKGKIIMQSRNIESLAKWINRYM